MLRVDLLLELRFLLLQLVAGQRDGFVGAHQLWHTLLVELRRDALGVAGTRIRARQPEQHMEQLAHQPQRIQMADRRPGMYRLIAEALDQPHLLQHRWRRQPLEAAIGQQRIEVAVVRHAQVAVVLVQPVHCLLQSMASAHAASAWIGIDQLLRALGRLEERLEFGVEELKVGHGLQNPFKRFFLQRSKEAF